MLTKNALGNLTNKYKTVLANCRLLNVFGTLALATMFMPSVALAANSITIPDTATEWTSSENITVTTSTNGTAGVYAEDTSTGSAPVTMTLQSGHTINLTADADAKQLMAYGMRALRDENTITNAGSITMNVTVTGNGSVDGQSDTDVCGMSAEGSKNTLINSGTIHVSAATTTKVDEADPFAYGMRVYKPDTILADTCVNELTNNGVIELQSTSAKAQAWTRGMYALYNASITNNGTLTLQSVNTGNGTGAKGATGHGLAAMKGSTLNNYGTINVTAQTTHGDASAYGMFMYSDMQGTCTLNNYGSINVVATSANDKARSYQAYIKGGNTNTEIHVGNIDTWTMKLGETYGTETDKGYYVFGVGQYATLHFGVDGKGANFIISGVGDAFVTGKEYAISDMIDKQGTVTGYIASVSSACDFLTVELIGPNDYAKQYIKGTATITEDNSPVQAAAGHAIGGVQGHMKNVSKILGNQRGFGGQHSGRHGAGRHDSGEAKITTLYADACTTITDAGKSYVSQESPVWKAFLMPFYSTTAENNGAYDTNMGGLVVGASRPVNENFDLGFHASISKAKSDSDHTDSDALSYALGVNGVYNVDESLYLRGQLTGFFAENDISMVIGSGIFTETASANMDTYGMYAELAAGYDFALTPQHVVTPELALSYLYAHMEGFDSDFGGASFSMNSENYDALYADASVRWTGTFAVDKGTLKPTLKAGIRQALTTPETSSTINIFGTSATTHSDANETAFLCEAGLSWEVDDVTLSATYSGEFGDVEYSHMGMFKVEWSF